MRLQQRQAFTLVELMLLFALFVVLLGLSLPAVQGARASESHLACQDNLRQIGLAVCKFEAAQHHLPDAWYTPGDQYGSLGYGGLLTKLLPHIKEDGLARQYDWSLNWWDAGNQKTIQTRVKMYECPSAPGNHLMTGLRGINGEPDRARRAAVGDYNVLRGYLEDRLARVDSRMPGVLMGLTDDGEIARASRCMPRFNRVSDGLSNSVMFGEKAGAPDFWRLGVKQDGPPPGYGWNEPWASYSSAWVRTFTADGTKYSWTAGPCVMNCQNGYGAIYSFHSGGANFLFADGTVRMLSEKMSPQVLFALLSRSGGEVIASEDY